MRMRGWRMGRGMQVGWEEGGCWGCCISFRRRRLIRGPVLIFRRGEEGFIAGFIGAGWLRL